MAHKLVIVESPAKVKKIGSFLTNEWRVEATRGHIRDLPQDKLGIDVNDNFQPQYEVLPRQVNTVRRLLNAMQEANVVYIACDPDREGEAIAWHILQMANLPANKPVYRVTFTAITESAVKAALATPRPLDLNLIEAQQARRIIDRLAGYLVSPLASQSLGGRYSAGRVQSACLHLIIEREQAITAFQPETYWTVAVQLQAEMGDFPARLHMLKGQPIHPLTQVQADTLCQGLVDAAFWVHQIQDTERLHHPAPPFTTSTLQQAAYQVLDLAPERTMEIAQRLYEAGHITYHRTDGVDIAPEAQTEARQYIATVYGGDMFPTQPPVYETRTGHAQEAHEAIRPTDITRTPEHLEGDSAGLYGLIWRRFIASQMAPARYRVQTVEIHAGKIQDQPYPLAFRAQGRVLIYEGFLKVGQDLSETETKIEQETRLPSLTEGTPLHPLNWLPGQHTTQAPARFTAGSLIHELERLGIGRPSTYATTLHTLLKRGYLHNKNQRLVPTRTGVYLDTFLTRGFPGFFVPAYTARLEAALDAIAQGNLSRQDILKAFWQDFSTQLATTARSVAPKPQPTDETCPVCGGDLIERSGPQGKYIGCMHSPDCGYTRGKTPQPVTLRQLEN